MVTRKQDNVICSVLMSLMKRIKNEPEPKMGMDPPGSTYCVYRSVLKTQQKQPDGRWVNYKSADWMFAGRER